jgi:two-component system cell cycle sensor histidine kinase/response regulator CckA
MNNPLNILHLEDNLLDRQWVSKTLAGDDLNCRFTNAKTGGEFQAALKQTKYDLIISDFTLPAYNGMAALSSARQCQPDTPFLFFSGTIGEERAVESLKHGATDYVLKEHGELLVPAVRRALRKAEDRARRKQAEKAVAHLASIVESCDDAIIGHTLEGVVLSWNAGAERIYGYTAAEMAGRNVSVLVPPNRPDGLLDWLGKIACGIRVDRLEMVCLRKDGQAINVSATISPTKDATGMITGASIVARDVTQRKQDEKERLQLIQELIIALAHARTLGGLLPICTSCMKIYNDQGRWESLEAYIKNRSTADFTHTVCLDCTKRLQVEHERKTPVS